MFAHVYVKAKLSQGNYSSAQVMFPHKVFCGVVVVVVVVVGRILCGPGWPQTHQVF